MLPKPRLSFPGRWPPGSGVPPDRIHVYEGCLRANKFLVLAHGTTEEINRACDIRQGTKWGEAEVHRGGAPWAEMQMAGL